MESTLRSLIADSRINRSAAFAVLGRGSASGFFAGACLIRDDIVPVDRFRVIGASLPEMARAEWSTSPLADSPETEMWSRTIGALGGKTIWRRMADLRFGLVGCGRSGSVAAALIASLGINKLTLIDPDQLDLHCFGECDLVHEVPGGLGQVKSRVLATALEQRLNSARRFLTNSPGADAVGSFQLEPDLPILGVPESIYSWPGLIATKQADLLACLVDRPVARLAAAFLSKLYLIPLLDVGTGVFYEATGQRRMGADIRFFLPQDRCILCLGGVTGARGFGTEGTDTPLAPERATWRQQRAGSLRTLNQTAVSFGIQLVVDFLCGRVRNSVWLHLEYSDDGIPELQSRSSLAVADCRLCALAGLGDEGLREFPALIQSLSRGYEAGLV